jgi:hypothetical protein
MLSLPGSVESWTTRWPVAGSIHSVGALVCACAVAGRRLRKWQRGGVKTQSIVLGQAQSWATALGLFVVQIVAELFSGAIVINGDATNKVFVGVASASRMFLDIVLPQSLALPK